MEWHQRKGAGLLIRVLGMSMIAIACWAAATLRHRVVVDPHLNADAIAFALAAATVVFGSAGSTALAMGQHLFDRVEIAERWRRRDR